MDKYDDVVIAGLEAEVERLTREAQESTRWATEKWVAEAKRLEEECDAAIERGADAYEWGEIGWEYRNLWAVIQADNEALRGALEFVCRDHSDGSTRGSLQLGACNCKGCAALAERRPR